MPAAARRSRIAAPPAAPTRVTMRGENGGAPRPRGGSPPAGRPAEPVAIARVERAPRAVANVEPRQADRQTRALQRIEPRVVADVDVVVPAGLAVVAQPAHRAARCAA